jgi:hypothetical protein
MKERSKEKRREEGEWWKAGIKGCKKGGKNKRNTSFLHLSLK